MRLLSYRGQDGVRAAVAFGEVAFDLTAVLPGNPRDMAVVLADHGGSLEREPAAYDHAPRLPLGGLQLVAPVPRPPKFLAIGLNYAAHLEESGLDRPVDQLWFNKQSTCVIGPGEPIEIPVVSSMVDYEGELGLVVGRRCRHVRAADAGDVVAGFVVVNDVSVRDWQRRTPTMTMGKSFDTHGPLGPWIVSLDELEDPDRLRLRTWVNDEVRQDATTDDMVFGWREQIAHLSTAFTLEPGDVISTGTPAGVGAWMDPPRYLRAGDVVRISIDGIGELENPVVEESLRR